MSSAHLWINFFLERPLFEVELAKRMSYFLRVFGRSAHSITRRELAEFISAGSFFTNDPSFDPPPDSADAADVNWSAFSVHYDPHKRPVRVERSLNDAILQAEVRETLFVLGKSEDSKARQDVERAIRTAVQVFSLEVNRETTSDDCWEMLDSVQAFLAEKCDGIVYSPDDGFFDKRLRPIYKL